MVSDSIACRVIAAAALTYVAACTELPDFDQFQVVADARVPECRRSSDCAQDASDPQLCRQPDGLCVQLKSQDCGSIAGHVEELDRAVVLGSLFTLGGTDTSSNLARQNSSHLAVEEINAVGGIPSNTKQTRPLVMVSCDTSVDALRAAHHLVDDLKVPAIVGPVTSQDTLAVSQDLTVNAGTLVITPTAFTSSIADLADHGLTWQMVPSDLQRAPITLHQIAALESELKRARAVDTIKLAVVFEDNTLGTGARASLNEVILNNRPLTDAINLGMNVRIEPFDATADTAAMARAYAEFAPDIVLLAGIPSMVPGFMLPLEAAWQPEKPRPRYVLMDSMKAPELVEAVANNDDLRKRIRGTGVTAGPRSQPINDAFRVSYSIRYPDSPSDSFGMGTAYDATYAIALAIAGTSDVPLTGHSIANALRLLSGGASEVTLEQSHLLGAFAPLLMKQPITAIGTLAPLAWDSRGAVLGGTLEVWCVAREAGVLAFHSSGLTLDLESRTLHGMYVQCP